MNDRECENIPQMNSVRAKEGHVFSTILDIEIKCAIKRMSENKVTVESGVIAEYMKAREVEYVEI